MNDQWQQAFHSNHDLEPAARQDLFRQLWENWWPRLRVYLGGFTGLTAEDAEELTSDALLRAMDRADSYDPARAFMPWLYTLARNLAIGRQRLLKRRPEFATDPARLDCNQGKSGPEESLILEETRIMVAQAVAALPERERELACLVYGAGLGLKEAARITGEPLGTVKWRIHRLKAIVRSKMEDTDAW
jgi:RNA polymerase sigma-70 factor (ECF subfamily)